MSLSYPIRLGRLREGLSLVPGIAFYNVGNFSNFRDYSNGTLANTTTGGTSGLLNGPNGFADIESTACSVVPVHRTSVDLAPRSSS